MHQDFRKALVFSIFGAFLITETGCQTNPSDALSLTHESLELRQMQTRKYETNDEAKILSACVDLLQDMGFNIDESETRLGLITASKMRNALDAGQIVVAVVMSALMDEKCAV